MDEDQPRREELRDSQEDIIEVQPDKIVNRNVPSEGKDTIEEKNFVIHGSCEKKKDGKSKKAKKAKQIKVGGEPRAKESFENVRKDKHSLSENEKEEVKKREEAKEEIGGVSLCYCFYLFHVAEAYLNAIQT